jgi:uncharacterized protein
VRVVLDTNVVLSALLWGGPPRQILEAVQAGVLDLYTTPALLLELEDVLHRPKFAARLEQANTTVDALLAGLRALATVIEPAPIAPVIMEDPDDDAVLACAVAAGAAAIVSGDHHLQDVGEFQQIPIFTPTDFLARLP